MIALCIVLSALALLSLLLFLPIRIYATYNERVCVYLSFLGVRFSLYPRAKKTRIKGKRRKKKSVSHAPVKRKEGEKKDFAYYTKTFRLFLRILRRVEKKLRRSFKITVLEMRASLATGDAATTAILYGAVSQG